MGIGSIAGYNRVGDTVRLGRDGEGGTYREVCNGLVRRNAHSIKV